MSPTMPRSCSRCTKIAENDLQLVCDVCFAELPPADPKICPTCQGSKSPSSLCCESCENDHMSEAAPSVAADPPLPCSVCLCDVEASKTIALRNCNHFFCHDCLVEAVLRRDIMSPAICPECKAQGCSDAIAAQDLAECLTPEQMEQYRTAELTRFELENTRNLVKCPNKDCEEKWWNDPATPLPRKWKCPACHETFCFQCPQPHSSANACGRKTHKSAAAATSEYVPPDEGPSDLPPGCRICPSCQMTVSKTEDSCNKFECVCGQRSCWNCGVLAGDDDLLPCKCTGDDHTFWDPHRNKPAPKVRRPNKRKRLQP